MKTAIRLDDITMNMDWERFLAIKAILDEAKLRPLIGVVPYPEDPDLDRMGLAEGVSPHTYKPMKNWSETVTSLIPGNETAWANYLKSLKNKGWSVALHGYNHLYTTKNGGLFPLNKFSEFAGVEYFTQLNMIKSGLKKLAELGIETDIFMAPGHTYDMNTLRALLASGVKNVTDGFGVRPYRRIVRNAGRAEALNFFPISRMKKECTEDGYGFTTHVLHCNTMTDEDVEEFKNFITSNRRCFIDYSEYLTEPTADRGTFGNLKEHWEALAKRVLVKIRALIRGLLKGNKDVDKGRSTAELNKKILKAEKAKWKKSSDGIEYLDDDDDDEFGSWIE